MKVVHISTYPNGGAGKAAFRLHKGLLHHGVDSKIITRAETNGLKEVYAFNPSVWFRKLSSLWKAIRIFPKVLKENPDCEGFSSPFSLFRVDRHPFVKQADVVVLHWTTNFLDYPSFFKNIDKPIVIYLHDMAHFLGGFHYLNDLNRFKEFAALEADFRKVKREAFSNKDIEISAPSQWVMDHSLRSELLSNFKHNLLYNCLDESEYKIYEKEIARSFFNLNKEEKVILFISERVSNYRKGADILIEALKKVDLKNIQLLIVGNYDKTLFDSENIKIAGLLTSEKEMAMAYSASDLFILPTREDVLTNVMLESLYCGTPVMSFANGGMREVLNESNGVLLEEIDSDCLARGIQDWIEEDKTYNRELIRKNAVEKFNIKDAGFNFKKIIEGRLNQEKNTDN
ncbi:glycosyltransferase [Flammeovirga sp. SJP92]|uniref:glycosyltransferase n=1 Tax=Flammeovirga sp. SJP92 TaxID=1775430 RepID=UPI000786B573|nr:glycosyltransferase [Flammeovirga sp. SJP92]KXX67295.1 hypothetical protein AVL50_28335 [Flammeovirga sp. SJP92]